MKILRPYFLNILVVVIFGDMFAFCKSDIFSLMLKCDITVLTVDCDMI